MRRSVRYTGRVFNRRMYVPRGITRSSRCLDYFVKRLSKRNDVRSGIVNAYLYSDWERV